MLPFSRVTRPSLLSRLRAAVTAGGVTESQWASSAGIAVFRIGSEIVGGPTILLDLAVNMDEENKRVTGEHILQEAPPPPCFCVCTGIIGLTGECLGCTGMIGLRRFIGMDEGLRRSEMAQEQRPLSITTEA